MTNWDTYGDGIVAMDAATHFLIKQIKFAQRKWNLSPKGLENALERAKQAEETSIVRGTVSTKDAFREVGE